MRLKTLKVARKGTEATICRLLIQPIGSNLLRLLKKAHLQRSPHPSSLQRTLNVRLTPQDFGRLASGHF
jgi:hypothetical protein